MSTYQKIRHQAILLLESSEGEYIAEPDHLASYFSDEVSFQSFMQYIYNKRISNLLLKNKSLMKANLRKRWFITNKTKANELLYKLLANQDELTRLKGETQENNTSGSDPLLDAINPRNIWEE